MHLQVSDLFNKRGGNFSYQERINDQETLIKRLNETSDSELINIGIELDDFCKAGIASVVFIEYILEKITKICSDKNISMS